MGKRVSHCPCLAGLFRVPELMVSDRLGVTCARLAGPERAPHTQVWSAHLPVSEWPHH